MLLKKRCDFRSKLVDKTHQPPARLRVDLARHEGAVRAGEPVEGAPVLRQDLPQLRVILLAPPYGPGGAGRQKYTDAPRASCSSYAAANSEPLSRVTVLATSPDSARSTAALTSALEPDAALPPTR